MITNLKVATALMALFLVYCGTRFLNGGFNLNFNYINVEDSNFCEELL